MRKSLVTTSLLIASLTSIGVAVAAGPLFITEYRMHAFDQSILGALGYDSSGSITYFRELGAISEEQLKTRKQYETIGCHPFYVMQNGKTVETGYDCRSFFCVGYDKGPKVCKDREGKAYGGVVEINRRLGLITVEETRKSFADYPASSRSDAMNRKIDEYNRYRCSPFYQLDFDVVVGEGFACEEIGKYPRYSGDFSCMTDLRNKAGQVCSIQIRENELEIREGIVAGMTHASSSRASSSSGSLSSSSSSGMGSSAASSTVRSSSSASSLRLVAFPDVVEGKYGYTAIVSLATLGVIKGYPDGTFRPWNTVNRAEFMRLLIDGLHPGESKGETSCFPDVKTEWFSSSVCAGRRLSWVSGYADKKFHPERTMKKSEAMKIVIASLQAPLFSTATLPQGTPDNQWYSAYIRKAVELGIILEPTFNPDAQVTRADAAVWMYRAGRASVEQ